MRTIKRSLASIGLLVVMALTLTGCVHLDRSVSLNNDGSGSYVLTIGINDQLLSLSGGQITGTMTSYGDQIKQDGGSYRQYDDAGYTYWAYTRPFKSVTDLNTFLKQMPSSSSSTSGAGSLASSGADTITFSEQPGFLSNTFHVTGHISLNIPSSATDTGGVDISPYLKDMRDSLAVTMPGAISSHKGGVVSGDTITYTVHYGEETDIDVTGSALNTSTLIPIGAGVALVVLLLAVGGFLLWRRRNGARKPQIAQAAYGGPYSGPYSGGPYSGMGSQPSAPSWPATNPGNPSMPSYAPPAAPTPPYGGPTGPAQPYQQPPSNSQTQWPGSPQ